MIDNEITPIDAYENFDEYHNEYNPNDYFMQYHEMESKKETTPESDDLSNTIEFIVDQILQIESGVKCNSSIVQKMISSSFWSGTKSKINILNNKHSLVVFNRQDAFKFLQKVFGNLVDVNALKDHLCKHVSDKAKIDKLIKSVMSAIESTIIDYVMLHNQRDQIQMRVDMFTENGRIDILDEQARVVFPHTPFGCSSVTYNQRAVDDYLEHFPLFNDFMDFIVSARFARDRKKAYLWMKCDSDWGKGFLLSLLGAYDLTVDLTVAEVEKLMSGGPVGKSMQDFKRAFVISIDEFKTIRDEIKQLQNKIEISPKNQLSVSVEIFAKVFTSAEDVPSLAGEHGVEDQLANRFSMICCSGDLNRRSAFVEFGKGAYFDSVSAYFAQCMDEKINTMISLGRSKAEKVADAYLDKFHKDNGIDRNYERFSTSLNGMCEEMVEWFNEFATWSRDKSTLQISPYTFKVQETFGGFISKCDGGITYINSPSKMINAYLEMKFDYSQVPLLKRRRSEIVQLISFDGLPVKNHRYRVRQTEYNRKSLKIKKGL